MTGQSGAGRGVASMRALFLLLTVVALACTSQPPPTTAPGPSSTPSPATTTPPPPLLRRPARRPRRPHRLRPTPPPKSVGDLALEMCDPRGAASVRAPGGVCLSPSSVGLALTYSTEWADGRLTDRPGARLRSAWVAGRSTCSSATTRPQGPVERRRVVAHRRALALGTASAIPTFDGLSYYVFDD